MHQLHEPKEAYLEEKRLIKRYIVGKETHKETQLEGKRPIQRKRDVFKGKETYKETH